MEIKKTVLGLSIIELEEFHDERGHFSETFQHQQYETAGVFPVGTKLVQDNLSFSRKGVLRGMHSQSSPFQQGKLIQVLSGSIYDVVVDARKESVSYGKWEGRELHVGSQLYVDEGLHHGFQCLSDEATIIYKCTNYYNKPSESPIHYSSFGIKWPIKNVIVSEKDNKAPRI